MEMMAEKLTKIIKTAKWGHAKKIFKKNNFPFHNFLLDIRLLS